MKAWLAVLMAATIALTACGKRHEGRGAGRDRGQRVPVRIAAVEAKPHVAMEDVVGTVRAKLRAAIEAKISSRIEKVLVAPGQHVKAGELLAELDVREMQAKLDQALAIREQAESDLKRLSSLVSKGAVTQQEFDLARSKARVSRGALAEAETTLGYAKIVAPFDGVIARKLAEVGDLATPGKPILEIEDPTFLRFEAGIPEGVLGNIALGMKLRVRASDRDIEGTVSEIAPLADPGSRTSLVKIDLPDTKGLRAGQFGRVSVPVSTTSVLRAPASAVIRRGQMEIVFVLEDGHARLRLVKTGKRLDEEVEILSGINSTEQVITEGAAGLVDGQPVEVKS